MLGESQILNSDFISVLEFPPFPLINCRDRRVPREKSKFRSDGYGDGTSGVGESRQPWGCRSTGGVEGFLMQRQYACQHQRLCGRAVVMRHASRFLRWEDGGLLSL